MGTKRTRAAKTSKPKLMTFNKHRLSYSRWLTRRWRRTVRAVNRRRARTLIRRANPVNNERRKNGFGTDFPALTKSRNSLLREWASAVIEIRKSECNGEQ